MKQGKENVVRRLGIREAFHRIFPEITVNSWNRLFVERAIDLTVQLAEAVPVYELICTPDHRAVEALKEQLLKEGLE